jgi:hypothetical protein
MVLQPFASYCGFGISPRGSSIQQAAYNYLKNVGYYGLAAVNIAALLGRRGS